MKRVSFVHGASLEVTVPKIKQSRAVASNVQATYANGEERHMLQRE